MEMHMSKSKKKPVVEVESAATETNPETPRPAVADEPAASSVKRKAAKAVRLLSSEKGAIACAEHAPIRGSDTWKFDRWRAMTAADVQAFERELGHKIACETCAGMARRGEAAEPAAGAETTSGTPDAGGEPGPAKQKGKRAKGDLTLSDLTGKYLAHMETDGKSSGTVFSYRLELQTALANLGADTRLADLRPEQVLGFFGSEKVNKTRTGKPKSPLSIAKTQRVLRQALVWAAEKRLIEKAPLPENLATH
jgi:hypothetical protein